MSVKGKIVDSFDNSNGLIKLSVSKAKTFDGCQLKFRFSYIERLPKKDWDHLHFGNLLHATLETFHKDLMAGTDLPLNSLMAKSFTHHLPEYKDKIDLIQKDEAYQILVTYLKNFAAEIKAKTAPEIVGVEKAFYINIDDQVLLNGFIDRIQIDSDGVLHVADYKTTKKKEYLKEDKFQLKAYAYVSFLNDPSLEVVRTSYILLRHDSEFMMSEFSRDEIMPMEDIFIEYADRIKAEKLYRSNPTPLCKFCDFLSRCKDGMRFVDILEERSNNKKVGLISWG